MAEGLRTAIYVRISKDPTDERAGVERQEKDGRALAKARGWKITKVYADNDVSAWKQRRVKQGDRSVHKTYRPEWERMLRDAEAGEFQRLIVYDIDRLARQPRDLEDLLQVVDHTGVKVVSVTTGDLNLNDSNGRFMARILVNVAEKASADTSRRVKRAIEDRAQQGKVQASQPSYGFDFVTDAGGKVVTLVQNPVQAALVREAAERLLNGEAMYGVVMDFNRRGLRTRPNSRAPKGAIWRSKMLKKVLTTPTVSGYREHNGDLFRGDWDPILDEETRQRLVTLLYDPVRIESGWNGGTARKYALSGLVKCMMCGRTMSSMSDSRLRGPSFVCRPEQGGCGHVRIAMAALEAYVVGRIHAHLGSKEFQRTYDAKKQDRNARLDLNQFERALENLTDEKDSGIIKQAEYLRRRRKIEANMEAARAAITASTAEVVRSNLPGPDEFVRLWKVKDNAWRRRAASSVIDYLNVRSMPSGMASHLTRRKNESEDAFAERTAAHNTEMMRIRVEIYWL